MPSWTRNWLQSDHWPAFAANLARYLATRDTSQFDVSVQDGEHDASMLVVDLADRQFAEAMVATLVSPSAAVSTIELEAYGPGQLVKQLQLNEVGQYLVLLEGKTGTTRHRFLNRPVSPGTVEETPIDPPANWPGWLTTLALLGFLLLLWWERK